MILGYAVRNKITNKLIVIDNVHSGPMACAGWPVTIDDIHDINNNVKLISTKKDADKIRDKKNTKNNEWETVSVSAILTVL